MHFAKVILLAGAVAAQSASTIVSDLNNIKTLTDGLTSAISNFNGQIAQAVPILTASNKLEAATKSATSDANAVSSATDSEQSQILSAAQSLYPSIISSLDATIKAKANFAKAGVSGQVTSTLNTLKSESAALSSALVSKATGDYKTVGTQLANAIAAAFTSALAGNAPTAMTLSPIPSASSGSSSAVSSAAASTSMAAASSKAAASSAPVYSMSSMPMASPTPMPYTSAVATSAAASSAPPAPAYTGAAGKNAASIGGAALLAAAVLAF